MSTFFEKNKDKLVIAFIGVLYLVYVAHTFNVLRQRHGCTIATYKTMPMAACVLIYEVWLLLMLAGKEIHIGFMIGCVIAAYIGIQLWYWWRQKNGQVHAMVAPTPTRLLGRQWVEPGTILDEELENRTKVGANTLKDRASVPDYWVNKAKDSAKDAAVDDVANDNMNFDQMAYVSTDAHPIFDDLLTSTYKSIATQDRLCPKSSDQCAKTPGGCPCVRPGGTPGLPTGFVVRRVIRVEDSSMWQRYLNRREEIDSKRSNDSSIDVLDPPVLTNDFAHDRQDLFQPLGTSTHLGEVYLWHGTAVRTALAIAQNDFNIDLAGCGAGTMYGKGAYLAESCTKADEYSTDEAGGYYEGIFALLLVRVCLGKYYYTTTRKPEAEQKVASGEFDSTVGDRSASVNTYREFVVYNSDQLYPEYIVLYSRLHAADDEAVVRGNAKKPFHMELPVYWTNCHCNLHTDPFDVQYRVRRATREILQRLVSGASKTAELNLTVVEARRVEASEMWNRYVEFKSSLQHSGSIYLPPNELDGNPESGYTLTTALLQDFNSEDAISVENLETSVNEFLLWHGTSQESAEQISWGGFQILKGEKARHGKRFGEGAYFAEDLGKSMTYATADEKGLFYVLLCRVTCGKIYYTEEHAETTAHLTARSKGMNSILANPKKEGPREYIVLEDFQVYPEFIIHLKQE